MKNINFFKEQGIVGRDLLDVCELLTYEKAMPGTIIDYNDSKTNMYIILDG